MERMTKPLLDKTLVAWVRLADLDRRAGSLVTLEQGDDRFDGIVYGELAARCWMAGSDGHARSQSVQAQADNHPETSANDLVQIAVTTTGNTVQLYRNGHDYATYEIDAPLAFGPESFVVLGLRHVAAGRIDAIDGTLVDVRIYAQALTATQLSALEPCATSTPRPLAWWDFTTGLTDRIDTFPHTRLHGNIRIGTDGLTLDGSSYLVASRSASVPAWGGSISGSRNVAATRALHDDLLADRHRPTYHIVTPEGHCAPFDPNAALFWKGRYHLMYIVQTEDGHCFAHISSIDLVHWRQHPLALTPGEGDTGIFSGGAALNRDGVPTITYWGLGDPGGICIATSDDDLLETWRKSPHNPVIAETQTGLRATVDDDGNEIVIGAADPSAIWVEEGRHYVLTGNLLVLREYGQRRGMAEHEGDTLYLLVSDDLVHWEYLHEFYTSRREWTQADEDDMCPDFFPLPPTAAGGAPSDRHLLLFISHNLGCQYYVGRYADRQFTPVTHGRMSWIDNAFFAPETLLDDHGRRIMWSWIFDGRNPATRKESPWSGTMSLPRVLWLGDDDTLRLQPAPELNVLRHRQRDLGQMDLSADTEWIWENVRGTCLELELEIDIGTASKVGVTLCAADDDSELTQVFYDTDGLSLSIDATRSSTGDGPRNIESGPLSLAAEEPLQLRIFVDHSVVEAFANDRQGVMRRIYPQGVDATGVRLFAHGGRARILAARAWDMAPANPW